MIFLEAVQEWYTVKMKKMAIDYWYWIMIIHILMKSLCHYKLGHHMHWLMGYRVLTERLIRQRNLSATRKLYNHQYYDPSALAAYYADSDDQLTLHSPNTDKFTAKYSNITSKTHLLKNVQAIDSQSTSTSSVSTKFGQSPEIAADTREILDNAVENVLKSIDIETVTLRQVVQQVEDIIGCKLTSHEQRYVSEQIDKCLDEL